jgi:hypothetical protein
VDSTGDEKHTLKSSVNDMILTTGLLFIRNANFCRL